MERYWLWLCSHLSTEPSLMHRLLACFGSPQAIYEAREETLCKSFPKSEAPLRKLCAGRRQWDFARESERLARLEIHFVSMDDPAYPERLRAFPDRPCGLFFRGELPEEERPAVAIVGARDCSVYGSNVSRWFGRELSAAGVQIISGMARGIDGWSHRGALEALAQAQPERPALEAKGGADFCAGKTYAVLAGGVDICYPEENRDIYMRLCEAGQGGVISENPPGTRALRHLFPQRNRILSGLADAVLIIEAREKSGSLITADYALEQGRDVYAVPGPLGEPLSVGCHNLIRQGAGLALSPEKLLEDLNILPAFRKKKIQTGKIRLERPENLVYSCLDLQARDLEEICQKAKLPPATVLSVLTKLQLRGLVREAPRNYYSRQQRKP